MITVEEARRIVMAQVPCTEPDTVPLSEALNAFVAMEVRAPFDHPLFDMSAVDGYAFAFDPKVTHWSIERTISAGEAPAGRVGSTGCARIFTGAMLPPGTDSVVMQEFVTVQEGVMTHTDEHLVRGSNVRRKAEQVKQGEVILQPGALVTPAVIGGLASAGVVSLSVKQVPKVAVLVTGNEFIEHGKLLPGRIFNSNDVMLDAALRSMGAPSDIAQVADDLQELVQAIDQAVSHSEVIITTGGASVGDHDLVHEAVLRAGGTVHFHGVAQKPGKPMLFASVGGRPFFGLPGNPRAVFVLFHEYVRPFLDAMRGAREPFGMVEHLPLGTSVQVKGERAEFRAARVRGGRVMLLKDEGSHMLRSLMEADALVHLPGDRRSWQVDDPVEVHYLLR